MSRLLKSFDDMSLKVVADWVADDGNFGFEFPASGSQSTPSALTHLEPFRDPQTEYPGWYHGGINE